MQVLVAFATNEGQTRKIARRVAGQITGNGHSVELIGLSDAEDIELDQFDRVVLAASIHIGKYQGSLTVAADRAAELQKKPTLFLSVSLAAAGHDAEDWKGLDGILEDFEAATGWTPGRVEQIAGAYLPSKYDVFRRFIMRRIITAKNPDANVDADAEYTDWDVLSGLIDEWLESNKTTDPR